MGVNIFTKNSSTGTTSNENGFFELKKLDY